MLQCTETTALQKIVRGFGASLAGESKREVEDGRYLAITRDSRMLANQIATHPNPGCTSIVRFVVVTYIDGVIGGQVQRIEGMQEDIRMGFAAGHAGGAEQAVFE